MKPKELFQAMCQGFLVQYENKKWIVARVGVFISELVDEECKIIYADNKEIEQ